jgi:uncharacterized membrane protein YcaP (DUF421 family)
MVWRSLAIYVLLLVIFRMAGRRALAEITTFDFVLLLIIAEATQQALLGDDNSMTGAIVAVVTLVGVDVGLSLVKRHWPRIGVWVEGMPLVLVARGECLEDRMHRARVTREDILAAARQAQGLERLEQVKYAVLERHGGISIIPWERGDG